MNLIPATLAYGMDAVLQTVIGVPGAMGTDGWAFDEHGFYKADEA
jgi:hypothetical protein